MKFKMRVASHSPTGNANTIGGAIAKEQKTTNDGIPPAYPIQNEKLLFIGVESKGRSFDDSIVNFCRDLTPERVHNVAFYNLKMKKRAPDLEELKAIIREDGINVIDNVFELEMNHGLFSKKHVTQAQVDAALKWSEEVIDSLL